MDHHTVAAVSIAGTCLDVLGSLYLAYDLLGGQHGPLRLLTRAVTYSIVFGIGYALGLGLVFGLAPALAASKAKVHDSLKEGSRGSSAGAAPVHTGQILQHFRPVSSLSPLRRQHLMQARTARPRTTGPHPR